MREKLLEILSITLKLAYIFHLCPLEDTVHQASSNSGERATRGAQRGLDWHFNKFRKPAVQGHVTHLIHRDEYQAALKIHRGYRRLPPLPPPTPLKRALVISKIALDLRMTRAKLFWEEPLWPEFFFEPWYRDSFLLPMSCRNSNTLHVVAVEIAALPSRSFTRWALLAEILSFDWMKTVSSECSYIIFVFPSFSCFPGLSEYYKKEFMSRMIQWGYLTVYR